eukprot:516400-Amphidinium_carterae.1
MLSNFRNRKKQLDNDIKNGPGGGQDRQNGRGSRRRGHGEEMMETMLLAIIQAAQRVRLASGMDQDGNMPPRRRPRGSLSSSNSARLCPS